MAEVCEESCKADPVPLEDYIGVGGPGTQALETSCFGSDTLSCPYADSRELTCRATQGRSCTLRAESEKSFLFQCLGCEAVLKPCPSPPF